MFPVLGMCVCVFGVYEGGVWGCGCVALQGARSHTQQTFIYKSPRGGALSASTERRTCFYLFQTETQVESCRNSPNTTTLLTKCKHTSAVASVGLEATSLAPTRVRRHLWSLMGRWQEQCCGFASQTGYNQAENRLAGVGLQQ